MEALASGDRNLGVGWHSKGAKLPSNLLNIILSAGVVEGSRDGLVTLAYLFTNYEDCAAANGEKHAH